MENISLFDKNSNPNPDMIVLAREYRGLTQTKLAKLTPSVSQGNLSRMEKGKLTISENALSEISSALKFPISFFYKKSVKTPISDFYYRKRQTIPKKKLSLLEAKLDLIRTSIDTLLDEVDLPEFKVPHIEIEGSITPEMVARKARSFLEISKGPVQNLVNILERNGVIVFFIDGGTEKFDGITLFTDKSYPIIFVNSSMPNDRMRFTIAHELLHLIAHIRNPFSEKPEKTQENEANRFASEFLMPELDIRRDLIGLSLNSLLLLKSYWGVSMRALIYRAEKLKAITENRAQNLYIEMSRLGYVKSEPGFVELDEPRILKKIVSLFENQLNYKAEEIAEILSVSKEDFESLILGKEGNIIKLKRSNPSGSLKFTSH